MCGGAGGSRSGACPAPLILHTQVDREPCAGAGPRWAPRDGAPPSAVSRLRRLFLSGSLCSRAAEGPWPRVRPLGTLEPCPGEQTSPAELLLGAVGQSLTRGLRSPERNLQEKALLSRIFFSYFFSFTILHRKVLVYEPFFWNSHMN